MPIAVSILMAVAPALILLRYFYRRDVKRPEPKGLIAAVFIWGILSTIPIVLMEAGIAVLGRPFHGTPFLFHLFRAFVVAGFCEEYMKRLVVKWAAYHRDAFDEVMDGIVYTVVASLGFACLENVLYVLDGGWEVALLRAFTAVPMHAFMSGIMGYYIGQARFARSKVQERRLLRSGLIIAILIHGLYDFLIFANEELGGVSVFGIFPLVLVTFLVLRAKMKKAIAADIHARRV